jgi:peptidoglycan hydrolase-like protein with peptidoglycan-binding domain
VRVQPDGNFGPRTTAAVAHWQRVHHLVPDGVVGARTWRTAVVLVQRLEAHDRAVARARAHALAVKRLRAMIARYDGHVVRLGARGEAVRFVQQRLRLHADGVFGPRTYAAVRQLQRRHHLTADGVVGRRTWHALG